LSASLWRIAPSSHQRRRRCRTVVHCVWRSFAVRRVFVRDPSCSRIRSRRAARWLDPLASQSRWDLSALDHRPDRERRSWPPSTSLPTVYSYHVFWEASRLF